jgi:hypothetical protein
MTVRWWWEWFEINLIHLTKSQDFALSANSPIVKSAQDKIFPSQQSMANILKSDDWEWSKIRVWVYVI